MNFRPHLRVLVWVAAWLVLIDVALQLAFTPKPGRPPATTLQRYFDYGRSIEGKLERAVALDPAKDDQIIDAGWNSPKALGGVTLKGPADANLRIALYGQSFTHNAAAEAAALDGRIALRQIGGPGAPPSHSYAAYDADTPYRQADVVLFGVLSSSVPMMGSMSGLFWMFESPAPFSFPRYRLEGDKLVAEQPMIASEEAFRAAFGARSDAWQRYKDQLRRHDRGYDGFTMEQNLADRSALLRLIRRGWVAHRQAYEAGVYEPGRGFDPQSEEVRVLEAMLKDLARRTRARGERLVVLLLHTRGQSDHLHAVLQRTLKANGIEYVSSHEAFSANDPANFVADGHYAEAANRRLAQALLARLGRAQPAR